MKKVIPIICIISICLLAGCSTRKSALLSEEEVVAEVSKVVPVAFELTDTVEEEGHVIYSFCCKDRDFTFTARVYVVPTVPSVPIPQFITGYHSEIVVSYWTQIRQLYAEEIRNRFKSANLYDSEIQTNAKLVFNVLLEDEEALNRFVDIVMENEVLFEEELQYMGESTLSETPLFHYSVYIPYTRVYSNGETENTQRQCYSFASSPTQNREELYNELKGSIDQTNAEIEKLGNTVLYRELN